MSTRGKITHLRYTDPLAARATVHVALRDHGSIVGAARALHCSATWLRGYLAAEPAAAEGLTLRRRGWPLGKRRGTPRPAVVHATTDCPDCPACGMSTGVTEGPDGATLPSPRLVCAACGHAWSATLADRQRAERADAAHYAELRAERATVAEPRVGALGTCDTCGACALPWRECSCGDERPCPLDVAAGCS